MFNSGLHPQLHRHKSLDKLFNWQAIVTLTLATWLGASLLLDFVIMPGLYLSGMMTQADFPMAGHLIFSTFNRFELLCAALVLTGVLVLCRTAAQSATTQSATTGRTGIILALFLMATALIYTYSLTPEMTALGAEFNLFDPSPIIPAGMEQLHQSYWGLEAMKLVLAGILLVLSDRHRRQTTLSESP